MCPRRQGLADGEADFSFAKRSDGTPKNMQGMLGGLRMVSGEQHEKELEQRILQVCVRIARVLIVGLFVLSQG